MKFLHVNMTFSLIAEEQIPEHYSSLGGRSLTSIIINDLVPADCDPLQENNLLVFAPGFLSGTSLVSTGRLSIGAKSPLIPRINCMEPLRQSDKRWRSKNENDRTLHRF